MGRGRERGGEREGKEGGRVSECVREIALICSHCILCVSLTRHQNNMQGLYFGFGFILFLLLIISGNWSCKHNSLPPCAGADQP